MSRSRAQEGGDGSCGRTSRKHSVVVIVLGVMLLLVSLGACSGSQKPPIAATTSEKLGTSTAPPTTGAAEPDEEGSSAGPVGSVPVPPSQAPAATASCRTGDPLANVYHPDRLKVITPCATVSGIVAVIRSEADGDVHFNLALDASYANLINDGNRSGEGGNLVIEIVPADRPGCAPGVAPKAAAGTYDYGTCTGAGVATPAANSHVTVTGPYVLDTFHGWMEIHPAWAVVPDGAGSPPPAAASDPVPPATADGGGTYYANCAAARSAGVAPLHRGDPGYRAALDRDSDGVACE